MTRIAKQEVLPRVGMTRIGKQEVMARVGMTRIVMHGRLPRGKSALDRELANILVGLGVWLDIDSDRAGYTGCVCTLEEFLIYHRFELHQSSIRQPTIAANSFEIRPSIIQMIGTTCIFNGLVNDDPNLHLQKFNEICETFKYNGIPDDFIKLKLFPFSLGNDARIWLNSQSPNSITTYDQLAQAFLNRYFPPGKAARLRNEILSFQQYENESIYEAWERFKELQRRCPHNGLAKWQTLQAFYQGLTVSTRNLVDAAAGGSLMSKSMDAASELLEEMALNNSHWGGQRQVPKKIPGVLEVDERTSLQAQLASQNHQIVTLQNQFAKMSVGPRNVQVAQCEWCLGPHSSMDCQVGNPFASSSQEQVSFVNYNRNFQNQPQQHHATQNPQNNPYQNTYNPPWRNNQNLSWKDNQP
ncbi:hypothetical protein LWI29_037709 [Acer saccharum]|uniref:Retrotransposon gag domain-containing protein n=1 Tax=Acer saccharum TaxID=4024 RepID=A0AA39T396_ACESA|nr:hypothetical protein LWI29_037709 [Acer saccharum]